MHLQIQQEGPIERVLFDRAHGRMAVIWRDVCEGEEVCHVHDLHGLRPHVVVAYPKVEQMRSGSMMGGVFTAFSGRLRGTRDDGWTFQAEDMQVFDTATGTRLWIRPVTEVITAVGDDGGLLLLKDGKVQAQVRTQTGEPLPLAEAAALETRWRAGEFRSRTVFTEMGGLLEGQPEFSACAAKVQAATGMQPVMKLKTLRHAGLDLINFHASQAHDYREYLIILDEQGRLLWQRESVTMRGRSSHLVSHDWNLTEFVLEDDWLVFIPDERTLELVHLVPPPLVTGWHQIHEVPAVQSMLHPGTRNFRIEYLPERFNLTGLTMIRAMVKWLFLLIAAYAVAALGYHLVLGRHLDSGGTFVLLMMLLLTGIPWWFAQRYEQRMLRLAADIQADQRRQGIFLRPDSLVIHRGGDKVEVIAKEDIVAMDRRYAARPTGHYMHLRYRTPKGRLRSALLLLHYGPYFDRDMDGFERKFRDWLAANPHQAVTG